MIRWTATATLLASAVAFDAAAQTTTVDPPGFFRAEARMYDDEIVPPPPDGFGPDSEYDDLAMPEDAAARVPPPPVLSFDPASLVNLPFGLERVDDPALLYFLEYYATEGRRRMSNWLARGGRYRDLLEPMLEGAEAPPELFWVIAAESDFDPNVQSHAGAVGLWQFIARTGRAHGLRVDGVVDERRDPFASTEAAASYFVELYERFGSWPLALAAYNAGHGHVRGELRTGNLTDFWELDDYEAIYSASRRYALRIMTIAIVDRNRSHFGYDSVVPDEPWRFEVVDAPANVRLSLLGEAIDLSAAALRDLNPALVANRTPGDVDSWPLRIPVGTSDAFVANYDRLRSRYGEEHQVVVLRFGETLEDIAEAYDIPARVLRSINDLPYDAVTRYGSELLVPGRRLEPRDETPTERQVVLVPQTRFEFADRTRIFYTTRAGDSLAAVARHFGVDAHHLAAWNDLDADAALVSGLVLQVFVDPAMDLSETVYRTEEHVQAVALNSPEWDALREAEETRTAAQRRYYTVRSGDTVLGIAARFGCRSADIIRWNDLGDEAMIVVGQRLVIAR